MKVSLSSDLSLSSWAPPLYHFLDHHLEGLQMANNHCQTLEKRTEPSWCMFSLCNILQWLLTDLMWCRPGDTNWHTPWWRPTRNIWFLCEEKSIIWRQTGGRGMAIASLCVLMMQTGGRGMAITTSCVLMMEMPYLWITTLAESVTFLYTWNMCKGHTGHLAGLASPHQWPYILIIRCGWHHCGTWTELLHHHQLFLIHSWVDLPLICKSSVCMAFHFQDCRNYFCLLLNLSTSTFVIFPILGIFHPRQWLLSSPCCPALNDLSFDSNPLDPALTRKDDVHICLHQNVLSSPLSNILFSKGLSNI